MNPLPLVLRELYVAGRSRSALWWRTAFGAGGMGAAVWCFLVWGGAHGNGHWIYTILVIITALLVVTSSWLIAADKISRERREGTLGFLFLTNLLPADIILGKFAAAALLPGTALLAVFPGLALCQLLGGVPQAEFLRGMAALVLTLVFSISATLFVSSLSVDHRKAYVTSASVLLLLNPLWLCLSAFGSPYAAMPWLFWMATAFFLMFSVLLLGASAVRMSDYWHDAPVCAEKRNVQAELRFTGLAEADPVAWLMCRRRTDARLRRISLGFIALVFSAALAFLPNALMCLLVLFAAHLACHALILLRTAYAFYTDRQDGSLELLLGSTLQTASIFEGFSEFLRRRSRPVLITFVVGDFVCALCLAATTSLQAAALPLAMAATLWVSIFGFGWLGVYRSLLSNHPPIAMLQSFLRLSFVPMVLSVAFLFAPGTSLAKVALFWVLATAFTALFFVLDAQAALKKHGRELLLRPFSEKVPEIENEWSFINWDEEEQANTALVTAHT